MKRLRSLIRETRRRHVFRVAGIYIVAAWVVVQVADTAFPGMSIPDAAIRYVWLATFLGLPIALIFGWRYDITAHGIVRTPPADSSKMIKLALRRTDFVILALLAVVAAGVIYQLTIQITDSRSTASTEIVQRKIERNSIAVLPLDNLSENPEQTYFVEGMHEALIAGLSQVSGLTVISRTSTKQFESSELALPDIARQLGAAKIIEGSVYRVADQVRITLQLIDAETDEHLWAKNYERDLKNILQMQGDVAGDIAQAVKVKLTQDESERFARRGETSPEAYEAYLQGRYHIRRFTPQDMRLAEEYYQRALEIDPDYGLAYVGLAGFWAQKITAGLVPPDIGGPRWLVTAQKAIELDPYSAEAQTTFAGVMAVYEWDWEASEQAYKRAIELNPSFAGARIFYSHFLTAMGRFAEAEVQIKRGLELDPLNSIHQALYGAQLVMAGHPDDAISLFRTIYERDPGLGFGYVPYQAALYIKGMYKESFMAIKKRWQIFDDTEAVSALEQGYEQGGIQQAMLNLGILLEERFKTRFVKQTQIAEAYDRGGETDKAIEWLEKAFEARDSNMVYLAVMPLSKTLQSDPRFTELLDQMNLPH